MSLVAQNTGVVSGQITSAKDGHIINYAVVAIKGTTLGGGTNANGKYRITQLPVGNHTLVVSALGYQRQEKAVTIDPNKKLTIDFSLKEDNIALDEVVVTSNRSETARKFAPSLVTVMPSDMFIKTNSHNLSQGLRFQPGLRVENNCQNCGFNQVRINGLDGAYSQILIDSRPIFSALAGVYGLEQIPANMIDRVEVIRGGGSALYGSNAVGGVINIITREPLRNSAHVSTTSTLFGKQGGGMGSMQQTVSMNTSLVTEDRMAGIMAYGQYNHRPGHDYDGDSFTELPELRQLTFGSRAYYKTGVYGKLTMEFHAMNEYRRGGDRLELPPFQARIAEYLRHSIQGGGLKYEQGFSGQKDRFQLYASAQRVLRNSYYGGGDYLKDMLDPVLEGKTDEDRKQAYDDLFGALTAYGRTTGLDGQTGGFYEHIFGNHTYLTLGGEYTFSSLNDKSGYRPANIDQRTHTLAQYSQLEYKTDLFSALIGGRIDRVQLSQNGEDAVKPIWVFSPRANLRLNPTQDVGLRLSYSQGFRAPQFFDEEMHVELAGGSPVSRILDKNLKSERSHSLSGSVDYYFSAGNWQFNLMGEAFATIIYNQFTDSPISNTVNGVKQRTIINMGNGKASRVLGANIEGRAVLGKRFNLQAGMTLQSSRYAETKTLIDGVDDEGNAQTIDGKDVVTDRFERTPNFYGYFVSTLRPTDRWSVTLSGTYTGSMLAPHEPYEGDVDPAKVKDGLFDYIDADGQALKGTTFGRLVNTPSFFDMDLKTSYEFPIKDHGRLTLSLGLQNLLNAYQRDMDKGPGRASAYMYGPMLPRRGYVSLSVDF